MGNRWGATMRAALALAMVMGGAMQARAGSSDGLVLRAAGFFDAEASDNGRCEIPTIDSGIPVSSFEMGLWNTFGIPTRSYPQSSCEGWMELINNNISQGITITKVDIRLRIAGAGRFRRTVPTRKGWPTACRAERNAKIFAGAHLFPLATTPEGYGNTGSGVPHVAFVNLFPMVSPQAIDCLRSQYLDLAPDVFTSFPVIIRATATGVADDGTKYKSNPIRFTLTLYQFCGNGRVDNFEMCDPNAPNTCNAGACDPDNGACTVDSSIACSTDADCIGTCVARGQPAECTCVF